MSIITGEFQEYGAYKNLTQMARMLLEDEKLRELVRQNQFYGGEDWKDYIEKDFERLNKDFDYLLSLFYITGRVLVKNREPIRANRRTFEDDFLKYIEERKQQNTKKAELKEMIEEPTVQEQEETYTY